MTVIPFVCLGIGIALGLFIKSGKFLAVADKATTVVLIFLMAAIGLGIGLDEEIINNFLKIGFQCIVISLLAIGCSVFFVYLCEKTVLPLKKLDKELKAENLDMTVLSQSVPQGEEKKGGSFLVWIMPGGLLAGLLAGMLLRPVLDPEWVDPFFVGSLIALYICVGISQGANRSVFRFIRKLGFRILWLSLAIIVGSLSGGFIAGLILDVPMKVPLLAAGGMSFYSVTGAYMTEAFGLQMGTYGFIVNVLREFFTILLMPLLVRISLGSPIAGGAAGNMDTMLAPVTKFVGIRLGLVTLITGTILTFVVPFLLPVLYRVMTI